LLLVQAVKQKHLIGDRWSVIIYHDNDVRFTNQLFVSFQAPPYCQCSKLQDVDISRNMKRKEKKCRKIEKLIMTIMKK